jgi:hypothetical protein
MQHCRLAAALGGLVVVSACGDPEPGTKAVDRSALVAPPKGDWAALLETAADTESPEGWIIIQLPADSAARLVEGRLVSEAPGWTPRLEQLRVRVDEFGLAGLDRLFAYKAVEAIEAERQRLIDDRRVDIGDLNLDLITWAPDGVDRVAAARELNELDAVQIAYAMVRVEEAQCADRGFCGDPQPCTDPASCQYEQRYLEREPAGRGIEAKRMWCFDGGRGDGVTIYDLESGWNLDHEELDRVRYLGASPERLALRGVAQESLYYGGIQHGTAVLGELVSRDDGRGTTGIVPEAEAVAVDVLSAPLFGVLPLPIHPLALARAIDDARPGDVILIEQHIPMIPWRSCETNLDQCGYVPMEVLPTVPALIRSATARGIHVIEAAGNGSQDLDDWRYLGRFQRRIFDSGAVMVGATGGDWVTAAPWTNFGSRVDVHGFGNNVVTTGYGDLFDDPGECTPEGARTATGSRQYTTCFSGTSSASPIVTGVVAMLQGIGNANGVTLDPMCVRDVLTETGIDSSASGPAIGPLPASYAALDAMAELPAPPTDLPLEDRQCIDPVLLECQTGADCGAVPYCHATMRGMRCAVPCAGDAACGPGERCMPAWNMDGPVASGAGPLTICSAEPLSQAEMSCLCRATAGLACAGGADVADEDGSPRELPPEYEIDPSIVATLDEPVRWDACERATGRSATVRFDRCAVAESGGGCSMAGASPARGAAVVWLLFAALVAFSRRTLLTDPDGSQSAGAPRAPAWAPHHRGFSRKCRRARQAVRHRVEQCVRRDGFGVARHLLSPIVHEREPVGRPARAALPARRSPSARRPV